MRLLAISVLLREITAGGMSSRMTAASTRNSSGRTAAMKDSGPGRASGESEGFGCNPQRQWNYREPFYRQTMVRSACLGASKKIQAPILRRPFSSESITRTSRSGRLAKWEPVPAFGAPLTYQISRLALRKGEAIRFVVKRNGENRTQPIIWNPSIIFEKGT